MSSILEGHRRVAVDDDELTMLEDELAMPMETPAAKARRWWRDAVINAVYIASWFTFATLLSMYNKWMFSEGYYGFQFPLFVTTMHMATQFVLAAIIRRIWPDIFKPPGQPTVKEYIQKCVPCGVSTGLDIGLSNLSLKTITLSLYTMCKSSGLIFVLMFAFAFKLERFSIRLVAVILLITSGVLLMVLTNNPPSPTTDAVRLIMRAIPAHFKTPVAVGVMLVLAASLFGGLRWSLTQILLTDGGHGTPRAVKGPPARKGMGLSNPAATIFFLAPTMFSTLLLVSLFIEGPFPRTLAESGHFDTPILAIKTIGFIFMPGAIAFAMVMSEYYIIQRTGVVPMSIAGIFKEVTTILLSTWFFGDSISLINWIGLAITVAGIVIFTHYKYEKSVRSSDEGAEERTALVDRQRNPERDIALPAYSPVATSEDEPGARLLGHYSDVEHEPTTRNDPVGRDLHLSDDQQDSSLVFDARDHEPDEQQMSTTPLFDGLDEEILTPTTSRSSKKKDRRVRFDVDVPSTSIPRRIGSSG